MINRVDLTITIVVLLFGAQLSYGLSPVSGQTKTTSEFSFAEGNKSTVEAH